MKKDPKIFLEHIIESIREIEKDVHGLSFDNFFDSTITQDAVVRRLEIIGEAVRNLPLDFRKKYPQISWKEIAGMRDVLIHEYFGVDLDLVWEVVQKDIPELKKEIQNILAEL